VHRAEVEGELSWSERTMRTKPRILLVDDDFRNLIALRALLADFDLDVVEALSPHEALRQLLNARFDLIILDVMMPELSGFELADLIRSRAATRSVPLVFVTASSEKPSWQARAQALGCVAYLGKPIDGSEFLSAVLPHL
jgi:CheY-like chemotaxis protein